MIIVDSVIGNINKDKKLKEKYDEMSSKNCCERIKISRLESQRSRMRKRSEGMDLALTLPQGTRLKHGDVIILTENKMVVVEIEAENVLMIEIKENIHEDIEVPIMVGHTIGNLHRPIRIEKRKIYFPIQADTEVEMFKKLLEPVNEYLDIKKRMMVFEPEERMEMYEH
ncbi:MAG TPA: hypothetical protein VEH06_10415 [Candidatus Bathyarchaeia archaeon]|nr:hypothetical protein [Candidatus Bathyarchaeia archaeon]